MWGAGQSVGCVWGVCARAQVPALSRCGFVDWRFLVGGMVLEWLIGRIPYSKYNTSTNGCAFESALGEMSNSDKLPVSFHPSFLLVTVSYLGASHSTLCAL